MPIDFRFGHTTTPALRQYGVSTLLDMTPTFPKRLSRLLLLGAAYIPTVSVLYLTCSNTKQAGHSEFDSLRLLILCLLTPLFLKFIFQFLCALLSILLHKYRRTEQTMTVRTVSVLVPAWNEEVGITKTLRSILRTNYPQLEIIAINDGSTDRTHERILDFISSDEVISQNRVSINYLKLENGGKAHAMNRALSIAKGEIIVTIDADSVMAPDAIHNFVRCFDAPEIGGVAGNVVVGNKNKSIEWIQQLEYLYGFFMKRADSLFNSVYIIGGAAAAYRKSVLDAIGGFDPGIITEDIELSTRMLSSGYKTRYAPDAIIHTEGPSDFRGLCNQRLRWKYGRILTFIKHRDLFFKVGGKQNPYLTWMLLPMAVYSELMLLLEVITLGVLLLYTIISQDYSPILLSILLLTAIVSLQVVLDPKSRFHRNLLLLAPVAWIVLFMIDLIELQALSRSIKRFAFREKLVWQKWIRVGLLDDTLERHS